MRNNDNVYLEFFLTYLSFYLIFNLIYIVWMPWNNLDNSRVLLQKKTLSVSEWFAQKLGLRLKISIDISSRKKKNVISYSRIPNKGAPERNIDELPWVPWKYKNSLKKKKYENWAPVQIKPCTVLDYAMVAMPSWLE